MFKSIIITTIIVVLMAVVAFDFYKKHQVNSTQVIKIDTVYVVHSDTIPQYILRPSIILKDRIVYKDSVIKTDIKIFITDTLKNDSSIIRNLNYSVKTKEIIKQIEVNRNYIFLNASICKNSIDCGLTYSIKNKFMIGSGLQYSGNKIYPFVSFAFKIK